MSFGVRPARPEDETGILELFARIFGRPMTPSEWRWKYRENPDGGFSVIAEAGGRIVGHFGGCPMSASIGGRQRLICALGDVMTDPAFRQVGGRRNVFSTMGREMFRQLAQRDVSFGFGFPNARALEIGRRLLGYREHFPVREIAFPAADSPAGSPAASTEPARAKLDGIWDRCRNDLSGGALVRDPDRVSWRYARRPDRAYRMATVPGPGAGRAWAALALRGESLLVMDYLVSPPAADFFPEFVERLRKEAGRLGARRLVFWESPAGPYRRHLDAAAADVGAETSPAGFSFVTAVVFHESELARFLREVHFTPGYYDDR